MPATQQDLCFHLPIFKTPAQPPAMVLLLLGPEEACVLSTAMFGMPSQDLQPADLHDAAGELCNIFAGILTQPLRAHCDTELGLPQTLPFDDYNSTWASATPKRMDFAGTESHRIHVTLLDPAPSSISDQEN